MVVRTLTRDVTELYDLDRAPNETKNLAEDPALAGVRERFLNTHFARLTAHADMEMLRRVDEANVVGPGGTTGVAGKNPFDVYLK